MSRGLIVQFDDHIPPGGFYLDKPFLFGILCSAGQGKKRRRKDNIN
jgi:hypothetical protein